MSQPSIVTTLVNSAEPSIRYKILTGVLGQDPTSRPIKKLQSEIRQSPRVLALLKDRTSTGAFRDRHVYRKWTGAHWVVATLADIGYPPGDPSLRPLVDQVTSAWLIPYFLHDQVCARAPRDKDHPGVPIIQGRARRCASQQGNALFAAVRLGFIDDRAHQLAERLMHWQWPDGGWNCDRHPDARVSSFWESLIPLRALSAYSRATDDRRAARAAKKAAELFLSRRLYKRRRDGNVMNDQFTQLHYPCYWRYDILFGLKVMNEAGFIRDPRCNDALDLLESKRLPDGGFSAQARFYTSAKSTPSSRDHVDWGGVSRRQSNAWITVDALIVLYAAGRLH